ncbi:hypothetical protein QO004_006178 [Rhizobium mesoamericanum]|uniref:hypothetical protein n=1 Tax=Rhizobium mesoamericanum TaxID=1079800 RepID=UPI0027806CC4|nr:hypothetical protein [Rhizobium mesoamericanum]MDQ0564360.1 hypothetical protein [Rhizobium mesoamericanum]
MRGPYRHKWACSAHPEIVVGYAERHALDNSADNGKAICVVVRAFLRYLHLKGYIGVD